MTTIYENLSLCETDSDSEEGGGGSKIRERGQEYGKDTSMATYDYFELIFGRCPI